MSNKGIINISGISDNRVAPVAAHIIKQKEGRCLVIVSSEVRASRLAKDLSFFLSLNIYEFPASDEMLMRFDAKNHDLLLKQQKILKSVLEEDSCVVIAPVMGVVKKMSPAATFLDNVIKITPGEELETENLSRKLAAMGYERVTSVDSRGQFAVRGSVIDIFTPEGENPYRIELFDIEVDSVRMFNIFTQRSIKNLDAVEIYPAERIIRDEEIFKKAAERIEKEYSDRIKNLEKALKNEKISDKIIRNLTERKVELLDCIEFGGNIQQLENYIAYFYDNPATLIDYMEDATIMVDNPNGVCSYYEDRHAELECDFNIWLETGRAVPCDMNSLPGRDDYLNIYKLAKLNPIYFFTPFSDKVKGVKDFAETYNLPSRPTLSFNGRMDIFKKELQSYADRGYDITLVCSSSERMSNMRDFLDRSGLNERVKLVTGTLTGGMDFPTKKTCYIWDGDIFVNQTKKRSRRKRQKKFGRGEKIKSFADMKKGDFIVHENHGIGKFLGIEQLHVMDTMRDYLKIKYAGTDILYVPVEQMDIVQKYVGSEFGSVKLNKLSGGDWKLTKAKAKIAVADMAQGLLDISAARQFEKGYKFGADTNWQEDFENSFPYAETEDQLRAVEEIKSDMEKSIPMDRLLCGDVGFGKTEVAARAMFKCAAEGKQVAVLVPTTILASQHYYTLKDRFEKFPFIVEMLSRFRTTAQQKEIICKLASGEIDVVIGTHRILSKDVKFKDLGLLIIDEEQRFGVQHKEAIKQLKKNVDVLTLSATPIPRTLHMSLSGIKSMSLIEEPPEDRYPVQTYVMEQDSSMIKDAIEREIHRGGQAYVVFNRVKGIKRIVKLINDLVPDANVALGHGQMDENALEAVILEFMAHKSDVLVATAIIESGIDIPNVNTMIILDADRYGLSQLYQLRGRVGRSNRIAYAYFMYRKNKTLSDISEKRLRAIREFTEFGSGFRIAMRDLEIRGAGNLLGTEQHGHMISVGYELYCKLVNEAVSALEGKPVNSEKEEPAVEINVTAFIPDRYIGSETLKLQMYKKIAGVRDADDEIDIIDEMIDRFGEIPNETMNLIKISRIKALAGDCGFARIVKHGNKFDFFSQPGGGPQPRSIAEAADRYGIRLLIHGGVNPMIRYTAEYLGNIRKMLEELVGVLESFL